MENKIDRSQKKSWIIYILFGTSFLVGMAQFVFGGILDKVALSVGVSIATAGQLTTAYSLANAFGTPAFIMSTTKMDRRRQLLIGLTILFLGMVLTFALPGFTPLMLSRILLGVGSGIYNVSAFTIVAELAPPGRKARSLANLAMGTSVALVFGVPLGRVVANAYDWRVIFWGTGLLSLLAIFAVARSLPPIKSEDAALIPLSRQLALLKKPKIAVSLGVSFFMFISYSIVSTYITPFLTSTLSMNDGGISTILFGLGVASLVGAKLGGFLADHVGVARTLAGGMTAQALALVLISLFSGSTILTILLLMVWSVGAWTCGPMLGLNLVSIAPEASGIFLSLNGTFIMLGFAAGAAIGGIAIGSLSILAITWIGAATVAFAVVTFVLIYSYIHSRT